MAIPISNLTARWTDSSIKYDAIGMNVNTAAYAEGSTLFNLKNKDESKFSVDPFGNVKLSGSGDISGSINIGESITVANSVTVANSINVLNNFYSNGVSIVPFGRQTIWAPAVAFVSNKKDGAAVKIGETATYGVVLSTLDFDTATSESAQIGIQMPKSWNKNQVICQVVWSHNTGPTIETSNGVTWNISAIAYSDNNSIDTSFGDPVIVLDNGGLANTLYITNETEPLTISNNPSSEDWVVFKVNRFVANTNDTLEIDARFHGLKIHYTTDKATDE